MKKLMLILAVLLVATTVQASGPSIRVFFLGGQSNGDGRGYSSGLPTNLQAPQTDVDFYFTVEGSHPFEGQLTDLKPGSPEFEQTNFFGSEITFGRSMADFYAGDPNTSVAIIKYANGGTNQLHDWKAGGTSGTANDGPEYVTFQNTVTDGMAALEAANPGVQLEVSGMIWMQGESATASDERHDAYEAGLTNFIADVRLTYGEDLPFVLGQLSLGQTFLDPTRLASVRTMQANVAAGHAFTSMVVTDGFSIKSDDLHFDASGLQDLGYGFATEMQALVPEPATMSLLSIGGLLALVRRKQ